MGLTSGDFDSIRTFVERIISDVIGRRDDYFITGKVIKRNEANKLVWIAELGDQAIPVVGFDYNVKYYDMQPTGDAGAYAGPKTVVRTVKATVIVPAVGQSVLVACERGSRRLPRCLGVVQGRNWFTVED